MHSAAESGSDWLRRRVGQAPHHGHQAAGLAAEAEGGGLRLGQRALQLHDLFLQPRHLQVPALGVLSAPRALARVAAVPKVWDGHHGGAKRDRVLGPVLGDFGKVVAQLGGDGDELAEEMRG